MRRERKNCKSMIFALGDVEEKNHYIVGKVASMERSGSKGRKWNTRPLHSQQKQKQLFSKIRHLNGKNRDYL